MFLGMLQSLFIEGGAGVKLSFFWGGRGVIIILDAAGNSAKQCHLILLSYYS
jgi:hypothetical protein